MVDAIRPWLLLGLIAILGWLGDRGWREAHNRGYRLALQHFIEELRYQRRHNPVTEIDPVQVASKLHEEARNG
jgi:hypothetical protein